MDEQIYVKNELYHEVWLKTSIDNWHSIIIIYLFKQFLLYIVVSIKKEKGMHAQYLLIYASQNILTVTETNFKNCITFAYKYSSGNKTY